MEQPLMGWSPQRTVAPRMGERCPPDFGVGHDVGCRTFRLSPKSRARPVFVANTALCDRWMCAKPVC
jgi:hypothetical protein